MNVLEFLNRPLPHKDFMPVELDDPLSSSTKLADLRHVPVPPKEAASLKESHLPDFQRIGKELTEMGGLPLESIEGSTETRTGNYSVRVPQGGFLITSSGGNKQQPNMQDITYVKSVHLAEGTIASDSPHPSSETLAHYMIFQAFPKVNVITHTHDSVARTYGDHHVPRTAQPVFFVNLGQALEIMHLLEYSPYIHMKDHGQICIGSSVDEVLERNRKYHREAVTDRAFSKVAVGTSMAISAVGLAAVGVGTIAAVSEKVKTLVQYFSE